MQNPRSIQAIARFHADHHERATPLERAVKGLTARAWRPQFIGILTALVLVWIVLNSILIASGHQPVDEPPFNCGKASQLDGALHDFPDPGHPTSRRPACQPAGATHA